MEYAAQRLEEAKAVNPGKPGRVDFTFLVLTLMLLTIGVIMVLSASFARAYYETNSENAAYYFIRQLFFALTGVGIMLVFSRIPVAFLRRMAEIIFMLSLGMLALVLVAGVKMNGARRWFSIAGVTFQPSEIAKVSIILLEAKMICRYGRRMETFRWGVLPFGLAAAAVVGLLVLEPHLSASVIILGATAIMMFVGGTKLRWFILGAAAVAVAGFAAISVLDYSSDRVTAWLDPFSDAGDTGYQIVQSLYTIGSGGLTGVGLGAGRQKYLFLPEEHNDYVFSVICEELGFIGAVIILILFSVLIIRGFWLSMHCRDRYSALVCCGITGLLAMQVILNIAVVTNLLPSTGISLPFFSYGGTALWVQLAEMGIVLGISRNIPDKSVNIDQGRDIV